MHFFSSTVVHTNGNGAIRTMTLTTIRHVSLESASDLVSMLEQSFADGSDHRFTYEQGSLEITTTDPNPNHEKTVVSGEGKLKGGFYGSDYKRLRVEFEVNRANDPDGCMCFDPLEVVWDVYEQ